MHAQACQIHVQKFGPKMDITTICEVSGETSLHVHNQRTMECRNRHYSVIKSFDNTKILVSSKFFVPNFSKCPHIGTHLWPVIKS